MRLLYNLIISYVHFTLGIFAPLHSKTKQRKIGLLNWEKVLMSKCNSRPNIWFHCASLGEFEDAIPVFDKLMEDYPNFNYFLSLFSPSGYEVVKHDPRFHHVFYLPLDTKTNARKLVKILKPQYTVFSRSEIWPNFLRALKSESLSVFLIASLIHQKSGFIKWPAKKMFIDSFRCFDQVYCQNVSTENILNTQLNFNRTYVSGNSRIDRIYEASLKNQCPKEVVEFVDDQFCVIIGSCLPIEEKMAFNVIDKLFDLPIKWIVVPHEIDERHTALLEAEHKHLISITKIDQLTNSHQILYVNTIGQLKHIYKVGNLAVIGGGFSKMGIHSILEPAAYGLPITFGPNHRDYPDALKLLDFGGAKTHKNEQELIMFIENIYTSGVPKDLSDKISELVTAQTGAAEKTFRHLQTNFLPS